MDLTTAIKKLVKQRKRIRGIAGGSSAGKTYGIIQLLIDDAQTDKEPTLTSIVSESFPHLKRGAMRDFLNIMESTKWFDDNAWNKTDFVYTFPNGSQIEFFSADQPSKVRGPRRDRLFINEANNVPYETFDQLALRTKDYIWLDWNPTNEFWFYTELLNKRDDVDFIKLTYKDNEHLDQAIVNEIESHINNKNWWNIFGLGELGEIEGKIYTDWQIIDELPHEARLERYGLDFGYSNDPTAILAIYYFNGGYILDEISYRKGMSNKQIADIFNNLDEALVKADSAEPKSIDEISSYGLNILPATKGPDSIHQGIQKIQSLKLSMTKRSLNLIKEYRNYMWMTDKNGTIINKPNDTFNHLMDALRYGFDGLIEPEQQRAPQIIGYEKGFGGVEVPIYDF